MQGAKEKGATWYNRQQGKHHSRGGTVNARDRSRSEQRRRDYLDAQERNIRQRIDERLVAVFGNSKIFTLGRFKGREEVPENLLPRRRGRRPLMVRWFRTEGGDSNKFNGRREDQWAGPISAVTMMAKNGEALDYAVIYISSFGLYKELGNPADPSAVSDVKKSFKCATAGLENFLSVMRTLMPNVCPIVVGLTAERHWAPGIVYACRTLTASLWDVARQKDAFFIDIEEVIRRHFDVPAGTVPELAFAERNSAGTGPSVTQDQSAQPPRGEVVTEVARLLQEIREEMRQELRQELQKLREELGLREPKVEPQSPADSPSSSWTADKTDAKMDDAAPSQSTSAQACGDVPWVSGCVPGQPPPVALSAPLIPECAWSAERRTTLNDEAYIAIKQEILRIILAP